MDRIDRLLEYIHRTNPEITRQKLIEELGESDYSAKSIYFFGDSKFKVLKILGFEKYPPLHLTFSISKIRLRNFTKTCRKLAKNSHHTLIE